MKVTTWRKIPSIWKEIIVLSIKIQEEKTDSEKVISLLKEHKEANKVYELLFNEKMLIEDWPNFTFFHRLSPLEEIYCAYLPVDDIDPIMYFPLTKKIHAESTTIMALDALMLTSRLEEIYIDNTFVDDITEIIDLPLKILSIKGCAIEQTQLQTVLLRNPSCKIID
ncbi:hypothetical protein [Flammeovirga aprica]|uniref:Leucine-rich repeat domain-containing protein n=1 Tax=Flammeovirga aprica JL-4 TaxID=694437 RepID=A0A7X9RXP4_9BACT|nr:hypothetical protein [Flammeovirga aprica]NME70509.1 hypothetical protein [Flammeovirga aprica JL-4]